MPDLAAFEATFSAILRDPNASSGVAQPGYSVYRNNVASAAIGALRSTYSTVRMLLGDQAFDRLALDFFHAFPPISPILAHYGDGFAEYIAVQRWLSELPYLGDVARIDRLRSEAHVAADAAACSFATLEAHAADDWMTLDMPLHPACRFGWFDTPATSIWLAHVDGEPADAIEPQWRAEGVLVTRPDAAVLTMMIGRDEHRLLSGLSQGETVGEAAAAVAAHCADADISGAFVRLIAAGALLAPQERN